MTIGLVGQPLHELEDRWKAEARVAETQPVSQRCLCGGLITAVNNELVIASAVRLHNSSTAHEQWAIREGWR
jgi:hypothetical protein